jgi:hypothetical protein
VREDFDSKLLAFQMRMMGQIMAILTPFFAFASTYVTTKAHNMFALMFDLHFKCLDVVKGFVGRAKVIQMVVKYDSKSLKSLLGATFKIQKYGCC